VPASNNVRELGSSSLKWEAVYAGMLNNGANLVIPNKAGTLATMDDVELAAQSGTPLYKTGVWYAKMYRNTVAPSGAEYDGRNYADFSQVDRDGNPIIIIYEGRAGRWAEARRITPPAEYDGYITVTSKIWDIAEQAGQQGGRVLWSHTSREFTPYPLIVSFEDIGITGDSTVDMPQNPGPNQIVNKDYVDNHIPTGNFYHPDLFDWKWADHQVNDVQWLRADTFSWQDGGVYEAAYQHLAEDIDGKTLQSETVGSTTIQFYLADDGHKICPDTQESNVEAIYTATGVAWYYILDTTNQRFKLPRTKFGVTGLRDTVGKYVEAGLPDHNHKIIINTKWGSQNNNNGPNWCGDDATRATNVPATSTNASTSNSIYGNSDTVQPKATQMYLYFYVGEFTQTALENTAGLNAELFNDKVDKGHQVIAFQAPTAQNNYTWYRKYADGWVEQGGLAGDGGTTNQNPRSVVFPVTMANTNYQVLGTPKNTTNDAATYTMQPRTLSTTGMDVYCTYCTRNDAGPAGPTFYWEVRGMAA
jgi:hypothetical protein